MEKALFNKAIDLILPPRCPVTGEVVDAPGMVTPEVWADLHFIADPCCASCGLPFEFDMDGANESASQCAACLKDPPPFTAARASLVYDDLSRDLILGFKHGDQTHLVKVFLPWMKMAGKKLIDQADIIAPVPLHRWRLWRRRYNQSALLAQALSRETGKSCTPDLLRRIRATPSQGHLKAGDRAKNVRGAFTVPEKYQMKIREKNILLIDDVYTTGATVKECASVLLKSGASSVNVLSLARVVKAGKG